MKKRSIVYILLLVIALGLLVGGMIFLKSQKEEGKSNSQEQNQEENQEVEREVHYADENTIEEIAPGGLQDTDADSIKPSDEMGSQIPEFTEPGEGNTPFEEQPGEGEPADEAPSGEISGGFIY